MNRFEAKKELARDTRANIKAKRGEIALPAEDGLATATETGRKPERWQERLWLFEYDPINLRIIEQNPDAKYTDMRLVQQLSNGLYEVRSNKSGYLKADQLSYVRPGSEDKSESLLIGKLGEQQFVIVADEDERIIISPLFETLLAANSTHIDVQYQGERLRYTKGTFTSTDNRPESNNRQWDLESADSMPTCLDHNVSIRVSILEPDLSFYPVAKIETAEVVDDIEYPDNEAHLSFQAIQKTVIEYIKTQRSTPELVDQLRNVDRALHLPTVQLDNQMYTLTLRTSENADVLYFHNTTTRSNQDQVADAMLHMSIDEFLELASDDNRRQQLLSETLAETGFYFIRQHNGQTLLMDRHASQASIITPESPYFMDILHKAEDKLAEYFAAVADQTPNSVPLRSTRLTLADDIEQMIPRKDRINKTVGQKILHWLLYK